MKSGARNPAQVDEYCLIPMWPLVQLPTENDRLPIHPYPPHILFTSRIKDLLRETVALAHQYIFSPVTSKSTFGGHSGSRSTHDCFGELGSEARPVFGS